MHGPLRLTYALLANYMAKCQMSSGPYGPIFDFLDTDGNVQKEHYNEAGNPSYKYYYPSVEESK